MILQGLAVVLALHGLMSEDSADSRFKLVQALKVCLLNCVVQMFLIFPMAYASNDAGTSCYWFGRVVTFVLFSEMLKPVQKYYN